MYKNLLQNGLNTWKALVYLRSLNETMSGFDYRVHYDNEGLPDGIVWMKPNMRKILLQYGYTFFLDYQIRPFSKLRWTYSGTVVYTNDHKVAPCTCRYDVT